MFKTNFMNGENSYMEKAIWIGAPDGATDTCPRLVKNIRLRGKVQLAELRVTAMGLYRFYINGKDITDNLFMPGWTSYLHRTQVQTYDVSGFLTDNTQLSALLGKGWAASDTFAWQKHAYAARPALIAQLKVLYTDGSEELFCTDESWEVWSSFILFSEFYDGETQDITRPVSYLCQAKKQEIETELILQEGEDIVEAENVFPSRIFKTPKGETVLDFGQNMAGYVRIRGKAVRGEKLSFVPGEILDTNGNFYNANYRRAVGCRYSFTFSGNEDDFRPVFSFLGFRYLRLDEFPDIRNCGAPAVTSAVMKKSIDCTKTSFGDSFPITWIFPPTALNATNAWDGRETRKFSAELQPSILMCENFSGNGCTICFSTKIRTAASTALFPPRAFTLQTFPPVGATP